MNAAQTAPGPFVLQSAYGRLRSAIGKRSRTNRRQIDTVAALDAIEEFVNAIYSVEIWRSEFLRRANFVANCCGENSEYSSAWRAFQRFKIRAPKGISSGGIALESLTRASPSQFFLASVIEIRKKAEALLEAEQYIKLSARNRQVLAQWRDACRRVQYEAAALEVDGCYYLNHLRRAADADARDISVGIRAIFRSKLGQSSYSTLYSAARAFVAWVREEGSSIKRRLESGYAEGPRSTRINRREKARRGRNSLYDPKNDEKLLLDWEAAKRQRSGRKEFCETRRIGVKDLENAQSRRRDHALRAKAKQKKRAQ